MSDHNEDNFYYSEEFENKFVERLKQLAVQHKDHKDNSVGYYTCYYYKHDINKLDNVLFSASNNYELGLKAYQYCRKNNCFRHQIFNVSHVVDYMLEEVKDRLVSSSEEEKIDFFIEGWLNDLLSDNDTFCFIKYNTVV